MFFTIKKLSSEEFTCINKLNFMVAEMYDLNIFI